MDNFVVDLINKLKEKSCGDNPESYSFYYCDRVETVNRELKVKEIRQIVNFHVVIEKRGRESYIPIERFREVRKDNKIIWKR